MIGGGEKFHIFAALAPMNIKVRSRPSSARETRTDMTNEVKDNSFDSTNLLLFIYKWRKTLIVIGLIAAAASITIALIIPNKYKSSVILFPPTTSSVSRALLVDNPNAKQDILAYGAEEEAEQMIQVLNSDDIVNKVAKKYNLMEHYRIDPSDKFAKTSLMREYQGNVSIKRTELLSVQIDVMDEDPNLAANIANDIADLYDSTQQRIRKERALQGMKIVKDAYEHIKAEVDKMQDSLNKLMKLGVNDYESQSDRLHEALGKAILEGKTQAVKELEEQIKLISQYGEAYMTLSGSLEVRRKSMSQMEDKLALAQADVDGVLSSKFVVTHAVPSEKKAYPIRWLIVVVSVIAAELLGILLVIVLENINRVRKELK